MKKTSSAKERLEIVQPACWEAGPKGSLPQEGGRGVGGGIPPVLQKNIGSNFILGHKRASLIFNLIDFILFGSIKMEAIIIFTTILSKD
jgi:hypothetical protein